MSAKDNTFWRKAQIFGRKAFGGGSGSEAYGGAAEEPFEVDLRIAGVDSPHEFDVEGEQAVADLHEGVEIAADVADEIQVGEPRRAQDEIEPFVVVVEVVASLVAGKNPSVIPSVILSVIHGLEVLCAGKRRARTTVTYSTEGSGGPLNG